MNHAWHYDRLIETRKQRDLIEGAYYEKHHIVMKSMGGNNDKDNLVHLTAREHFIAHWLLWKIHGNRQTASAFFAMSNLLHRKNNSFKINSRMYEELRIAAAKGNEFRKGSKHSVETIEKMKIARSKYRSNTLGKTWDGINISKALKGHSTSDLSKEKMSIKKFKGVTYLMEKDSIQKRFMRAYVEINIKAGWKLVKKHEIDYYYAERETVNKGSH